MILVDYRCDRCHGVSEHRVHAPAPATVPCPACRAPARRRFAAVGLLRGTPAPAPQPRTAPRALCRDNPDVPGLCHMTPDAARAWVARARGDNRTLDRELARQERAQRENPGAVVDPVSHDHSAVHHPTERNGAGQ